MADMLGNLRLFIRVARTGSLSRTARDLGLSQSGVSRALSSLEEDDGGVLLTRTTRRVSLTEVGAEFLARVEPLVAALDDAAEGVRAGDELHGMLRVAMPTGVATRETSSRSWRPPRSPRSMSAWRTGRWWVLPNPLAARR